MTGEIPVKKGPIPEMALATQGELPYSIEDAKVYKYASGAPGAAVDIPGIFKVEMAASIDTEEHRGDNQILAAAATFNSVDLTLEIHQLNMDAIAVLSGGTVVTSGTTPSQVRTLTRAATDIVSDYQIKAQTTSKTSDGGAMRLVFPRCQWQDGPSYSMEDNAFASAEIGAKAIPTASGATLYQWQNYETSVSIT